MPVTLHEGDCLSVLASIPDNSIDSVVTDPPYEIAFMSRNWDSTGIAFRPDTWRAVLRVMKPGAHLLAFGGTRTFHRMAVAIEDAGFELRDTLMWVYGSGFPKSHDISKAIDKAAGAERKVVGINPNHRAVSGVAYEGVYAGGNTGSAVITAPATPEAAQWQGWGTALKPAWEPIILARKPLIGTVAQNVLKHGVGGLNIGATRIPCADGDARSGGFGQGKRPWQNVGPEVGRWPANVLHDGSPEVLEAFAAFGERKSPKTYSRATAGENAFENVYGRSKPRPAVQEGYGDTGTAARFFYCAKASKADRQGTTHPTTKPTALMAWLCRLVCPPGGTVLDPFAGSGSTGVAALREGLNAILIEKEAPYCADIRRRLGLRHDLMST